MQETVAKVCHLAPILPFGRADANLIQQGLVPFVLHLKHGFIGFVGADEVLAELKMHQAQSGLNGRRVICGAVFAQQIFQYIDWHICAYFDLAHQVFAHHFPGEHIVGLLVERGHHRTPF